MKSLKNLINETILSRNLPDPKLVIIKGWLEEYDIEDYTINDDLTIDINGDVNLYDRNIKELPKYIQFGTVEGIFTCANNKLTSLRGCPRIVNKSFNCSFNNLTSLKEAPTKVDGSFYCNNNKLVSLEGAPKEIGANFDCSFNKLVSLKGTPREIKGNFQCNNNNLTSLKEAPKKVNGNFYCGDNSTKFTRGKVINVSDVKGMIVV